ncbi:MAG: CDP-alcohol phosphatidyltransferase family protein [Acidobacteria bacterium]|nr:CDP-alcohol phosphatidyltransferase family protein [Acidobacteriota bacterium]
MPSRILSPANQITILRLLLVPLFAALVLSARYGWALSVLAAATLSDVADGLVARYLNQETSFGNALDPIADKILLVTGFLILSSQQVLPWWLSILVLTRDLGILTTALLINLIAGFRPFNPSMFGKASTVSQMSVLLVALAAETTLARFATPLKTPCIYLAAALTLLSGVHYLIFWREYSRAKA